MTKYLSNIKWQKVRSTVREYLDYGLKAKMKLKIQTETPLTCQSDGYGTLVKNSKPEKEFQL